MRDTAMSTTIGAAVFRRLMLTTLLGAGWRWSPAARLGGRSVRHARSVRTDRHAHPTPTPDRTIEPTPDPTPVLTAAPTPIQCHSWRRNRPTSGSTATPTLRSTDADRDTGRGTNADSDPAATLAAGAPLDEHVRDGVPPPGPESACTATWRAAC
jgi:hypothetical protein